LNSTATTDYGTVIPSATWNTFTVITAPRSLACPEPSVFHPNSTKAEMKQAASGKSTMSYPHPPQAEQGPLLAWRVGAVAHLRFNRPHALNAIDVATAAAFRDACVAIAGDPQVRAVVVGGEGRAFAAGGDVAAMREAPGPVSQAIIDGIHAGIEILADLDAPVIAGLHGMVAGGGVGVALACDLAIAAEGTRFAFAYPAIGASADCATTWALPRLVGLRTAMRIALLAEPFDAEQALRWGIVNEVVPADQLQARTEAWAQRLAQGPTLALGRIKHLLRTSSERTLHAQLDAEADAFGSCAVSADFAEGLAAFLDKRPPRFDGR
jgi:2-(1,2-epoxy-1,2-dihydrophenyl)acetyl-CoA isomerase